MSPPLWLAQGDAELGSVALVELPFSFSRFAEALQRKKPLFLRHLAPVQQQVKLQGQEADLEALQTSTSELAALLDPMRTFAVQTRIAGQGQLPYRKGAVNATLAERLAALTGATIDISSPQQIVSVFCTPTIGYIGLSTAEQNRSDWPGGQRRFRQEESRISRAEFKLLEAIEVFGLALPASGTALDIGAAPGGWTQVLRAAGLHVVAVDPAELDRRLTGDRGITHVRRRIQDYLPSAPRFDLIVNDMKMDAPASIRIMAQAAPHLKPGGLAIMTLKLPPILSTVKAARSLLAHLHTDLALLSQHYTLLEARQLYHNRNEVTVALRSRV